MYLLLISQFMAYSLCSIVLLLNNVFVDPLCTCFNGVGASSSSDSEQLPGKDAGGGHMPRLLHTMSGGVKGDMKQGAKRSMSNLRRAAAPF